MVKEKRRQNPMLCCHDRMRIIDLIKTSTALHGRARPQAESFFILVPGTVPCLAATLMLVGVFLAYVLITAF